MDEIKRLANELGEDNTYQFKTDYLETVSSAAAVLKAWGPTPPPELFKKVRDLGVLGQQAVLLYLGQVYREIEAADRSLQRKNGERPRGNDGKEHPESSADAYSFRTGVKRAVRQFLYEDNLENYQKKTNMDYGGKDANGLGSTAVV